MLEENTIIFLDGKPLFIDGLLALVGYDTPIEPSYLILEDGSYLLLEDGDKILLEFQS